MRSLRGGSGTRAPTRRSKSTVALVFGVVVWASTLVVLSRLQRAALPSRAVEPALPRRAGSWVETAAPEVRRLQESLRLHEVGIEALSWNPRIFLLHDFLTASECDELIALARPALEASTVVDTATGGGFLSQVRTSSGMFIMDNTPVTRVIRQRVAHLTLLPEENQEAISVLQYKVGQYYRPHQDFFADAANINRGGQRTATVLMYLSDVEEGAKGLSVRPYKGNAVLFYTMTPGGDEDFASLHGGCEVLQGEKWSATLWLRTGAFT